MSFTPGVDHRLKPDAKALVVPVSDGKIVSLEEADAAPQSYDLFKQFDIQRSLFVGLWQGQPCFALELPSGLADDGKTPILTLRQLLGEIDFALFELYGYALQILTWDLDHQYCGRCGRKTGFVKSERARVCEPCRLRFYPRLSPCVIGLVYRGNECLLARHHRHKSEIYTTIAGFMEPGETAEDAFIREVKEEVGVSIKSPKYIKSQSWPFPGQLMLGFWAEYQSGEIVLEENEIADAQWFDVDDLPKLPPPHTIARTLIELYKHKIIQGE